VPGIDRAVGHSVNQLSAKISQSRRFLLKFKRVDVSENPL
jgi:hypothetical protein